jgi:probable O-glycosylation ligase (exosortase A-associated)
MLRLLVVLLLTAIGAIYALQGPFYALLFYVGNAYFRPEAWDWTGLISRLKVSYYAGAVLLLTTLLSRQRFVLNGRIVLLGTFLLHTFLSALFSEYFNYCWPYWIEFFKAVVITYLMVVLITDMARLRLLFHVMVLALGLLQAKQGWYYLVSPSAGSNPNPIPFLGDNNGVAIGMLMLVPLVAYLAQTAESKWAQRFYWFLLIGCLFRALSTYSRGGFLACAALGGMYLLRSRQKARVLLGMFMIILVVLPALPLGFWERMQTMQTYEEDASATGRLHFWVVAVRMANAHPLLGIGHNAYNAAYNAFDFSKGEYGFGRSVHSSWFGVLAELGYVGMLLYAAIWYHAFRSCQQVRQQAAWGTIPAELGKCAIALEAGLAAFVVGGTFLPGQYSEMLWHFLGLTIVLTCLARQYRLQEEWEASSQELAGSPLDFTSTSLGNSP